MRYTSIPPCSLVLAVGWGAVWGTRTLVVHSLSALRTATVAGYFHVAMAILGAVALLTGAKVFEGSLTARVIVVGCFVVFLAAELPGVLAGAPLDAVAAVAHVIAAAGVLRASPLVYETRSAGPGAARD